MSVKVNVTPVTENGHVKWTLDVIDNGSGGKGGQGGFGHYPSVQVQHGQTNVEMIYAIVNGGTWKFASDPLWVSDNGQDPSAPSSVPSQIDPAHIQVIKQGTELHFKDANIGGAVDLNYTLNFVNGSQTASTLDPIIKNGGNGITGGGSTSLSTAEIVGLVLLVAVVGFVVWRLVSRRTTADARNSGPRA